MTGTSDRFILANRDIIANPYALYDKLRSDEPIHEVSKGVYFLSRHADCAAALTDRRLSNRPAPFALLNERYKSDFVGAQIAEHLIAFRDPPEVSKARKLLATEFMAFTRRCGPMLAELAKEAVGDLAQNASADFVTAVAQPYALKGMCRTLGFPDEDAGRLKDWSADFFYLFHAIPDRETLVGLNAALADFRTYTLDIMRQKQATPQDDLISQLVASDLDILGEDAMVDNIMLLAADGVENVWAGIANALMSVLENRETVEAALAAGAGWNALVGECLRLESPGQYQGRIALEDLEIGGASIRKFSVVLVGLAAGNRDPEAFPDPTAFNPMRKGARDLSFGLGHHACIGKTLVILQMAALFEELGPLLPRMAITPAPNMWDGRAGHRWLSTLPVTIAQDAG